MSDKPWLKPIELTLDGDYLTEFYPNGRHVSEHEELPTACVGVHKHCGGFIHRRHSTEKFDVLVCKECFLRILFHTEIRTYGELRKYLEVEFNNLKAHRASPWRA